MGSGPGPVRLFGLVLLAACSGGPGAGGPDAGSQGDGGGTFDPPPTEGLVVGVLELGAPVEPEFVLRATLPVPPGTVLAEDDGEPLTVLDVNGSGAVTQVETVSRHPDGASEGADVVEVLARVRRPEGAEPGDRIQYQVIHAGQAAGPLSASEATEELLGVPGSVTLHAGDVYGNQYGADLLADLHAGEARVLRSGRLVEEWATHSILVPDAPAADALDRMMGVHAFVSRRAADDVVLLSLRMHNGLSGKDPEDPTDDAYKQVYFDRLELRLPQGWTVVHAFEDPWIGEPRDEGGRTWFPLVRPMDEGTLHVLRTQGQFTRRLALAPEGQEEHARALLGEQGLAICRPGQSPDGFELWSWWNPYTARWFAQNVRLPRIDEQLLPGVRDEKRDELFELEDHLAAGTHDGYPLVEPPMGFWRPWGAPYGGMTGGVEIDLSFGIESAAAASRDAYRTAQLMARMYTDRQHTALYDADGSPARLEDWLVEGHQGLYFPGLFNQIPLLPQSDPFGFEDAPTFQTDAVVALGKVPAYQEELFDYMPIDVQHWVRFLRPFKLLVWLGNDSLARSEIEMAGEIYRLTHHEYPNNASGSLNAAWGLRSAQLHVEQFPGEGYGFNRANGWGLDIAATAYALGDDTLRARFRPWFEQVVDVAEAGQSDCGGYLQAVPHHSNGGQYRIRQNYEAMITDNALRALATTVFRGVDDDAADRIETILVERAYGMVSPYFWSAAGGAPHGTVAVGPYDRTQAQYCGEATDHWASGATDTKYPWNTLAYAYELTGDTLFLERAAECADTTNLTQSFAADPLLDLNNRFAMQTLLQALAEQQ